MKENIDFVAEQTVSFNSTVAGTSLFMSPEMKTEKPNGAKTDVWSLGITMGIMLGMANACPENYRGGVPQFIIHCIGNRHDLSLAKLGIYISPIVKNLLKNMLSVSEKNRFSMSEVLNHRFFAEDLEIYMEGYEKWV